MKKLEAYRKTCNKAIDFELKERLDAYRNACNKAIDFQMSFQLSDGGFIWDGYPTDAHHKQAYSWSFGGHGGEIQKLLTWIRDTRLQADGQLKDYNGDIYKHAWLFHGAHKAGRYEVSYPVMKFLKENQAPCGGLPHFAPNNKVLRALSTAWTGHAALFAGETATAEKALSWCLSVIKQQPSKDKFFYQTDAAGKLLLEKDGGECVDIQKTKQCYWEVGFMLILTTKFYLMTKRQEYLDASKMMFEFLYRCSDDNFSYWGSGKGALGAAIYYTITGDERAKESALEFCEFVLRTQTPKGGFCYEDEPDELLIYVDHAACFSTWGIGAIEMIESTIKTNR